MSRFLAVALTLSLMIQFMTCSTMYRDAKDPGTARTQLEQLDIPFAEDEFVKRVGKSDTITVQAFLDAGMNPNATDRNGTPAVVAAAEAGHLDIVKTLLAEGADVNIRNNNGDVALLLAERNGHHEIVQLLRKTGTEQ
jgi:ankyrin repeat protein